MNGTEANVPMRNGVLAFLARSVCYLVLNRRVLVALLHATLIATFPLFSSASMAQEGQPPEEPNYVGSQACGTCHQAQFDAWRGSHHGWALMEPTDQSVLGDFDDARFEHKGVVTRFYREGSEYFVDTDGADGKVAKFRIRYVVGKEPLQQYLVELDGGRLQTLDIAWDTALRRWYHLYPDQDVSAGNGLHWTGFYKNWQARCAVCHQTDFRKNYDAKSRTYQSTWSELTVGCEACHGPGQAHVAWAEKGGWSDIGNLSNLSENGFPKPQSTARQEAEQDMCGPCHSRRDQFTANSTPPGEHFSDFYSLSALGDGLYFPDGQQEQEVYILGSFLQSKMHEKGVTCTNCHEPHSAKLRVEGNATCTQCHNEAGRDEFPTLVLKNYDTPEHHRHEPGTAAAQCVSCHMPERTYMTVDARRDHFFRVPDPALSGAVGSPDACLSCHTDKTSEWSAAALREWDPGRPPADHGTALLFSGLQREGLSAERLVALGQLARDVGKPAIVRMSALRDMGDQLDPAFARSLNELLSDKSDLVRAAAVRLFRTSPASERIALLRPLLDDSSRGVRVAAALELASLQTDAVPEEMRGPLSSALDELRTSMSAKADFPEGQVAIGGLAMSIRNWPAAQGAFAEAVLMDPQLVHIWLTRAQLASALGDPAEAVAILTAARVHNPSEGSIASALAQLFLDQGRLEEAVPILRDIVAANPADTESRIAFAFSLLQTGKLQEAGAEIDRLGSLAPTRQEVLVLQALYQVARGDIADGRETVLELKRLYPMAQLPPILERLVAH